MTSFEFMSLAIKSLHDFCLSFLFSHKVIRKVKGGVRELGKLHSITHSGLKFWLARDSASVSMLTDLNHRARVLAMLNQLILHSYHEKLYVMISL